ncbi:hypothetical protein NBRC3257_1944 [Gluconobacter thailandicus NBRC 3257]|uniref:Uncharacterized protein n=1 Tax=Gluconobacter thailandicus NBRC 3257 TaxID=1381097 RepID=A0ABQ0IXL7_GLUTH|nr:hypothetical protein B932_0406 [Gluconobacter oxydans H24]GAC87452.1 hypothetical protein NBRC3255_1113 [Gluconobacter thailandicus NBRC 3255]GAD26946.1 hypothetical protein NBRC3257_1944 [Gluconobacter thailandicus NBRC 3257]
MLILRSLNQDKSATDSYLRIFRTTSFKRAGSICLSGHC